MRNVPYLRLHAVKHGVAWIICSIMLSPVLADAEDQAEQKHKKNNETSQKNNNENRSDSKQNQSSQSANQNEHHNNDQNRSSTKPDHSSSMNYNQRPSAASPEREHGSSRSMGDVIRDSGNIAKPSLQRPSTASPEREHGNPRAAGSASRDNSSIVNPPMQPPAAASPEHEHGNPRATGSVSRDNSNIVNPPLQRPSAAGLESGYADPRSGWNTGRNNIGSNYSDPRSSGRTNQPPQGSNPRWAGNIMRDVREAFPQSGPLPPWPINPHPPIHQSDDDDNDDGHNYDYNYCYTCSGYYQGSSYGNYDPYYEVYRPKIKIVKTNVEEIVAPTRTVSGVARRTALSSNTRMYSFNIRGFLERQVQRVRELLVGRWPGAKQLSQVAIETVEYCDNQAGIVTLTYYDQDNSGQLSIGDRFNFNFEHCRDRKIGITADGRMGLLVTEMTGDMVNEIAPYSFAGRFDFNRLNVVNDQTADRSVVQGNMDFNLSARQKLSRQNPVVDR